MSPVARTSKPRRFVPPSQATGGGGLERDDYVNELVVFTMREYLPDYITKAGKPSQKAVVDLKVLTGPKAGQEQEAHFLFGNLAKQAGQVPVGEVAAARVVHGPFDQYGKAAWYGLNFDLGPEDAAEADSAL